MTITIQNANGIKLCSFDVCSEYGYEQFILDNSLEGCKVINGCKEEQDAVEVFFGDETMVFEREDDGAIYPADDSDEIIIQLA
tara:strand:+ start:1165 stop:1413 length:249 start_codon:yes stop_codon:yes gene_type:complete